MTALALISQDVGRLNLNASAVTLVDMQDDKLTVAQVAARLDIQPGTWRGMVSRGGAPQADGHHDQRTPWWYASTIREWSAQRHREGTRRRGAA